MPQRGKERDRRQQHASSFVAEEEEEETEEGRCALAVRDMAVGRKGGMAHFEGRGQGALRPMRDNDDKQQSRRWRI